MSTFLYYTVRGQGWNLPDLQDRWDHHTEDMGGLENAWFVYFHKHWRLTHVPVTLTHRSGGVPGHGL